MRGEIALVLVAAAAGVVGCGGGETCGVQPCGGDVVGTWALNGGCANNAVVTSDLMEDCPGATYAASNLLVSGELIFTAAGRYDVSSIRESVHIRQTIPLSCFAGAITSCADLTAGNDPGSPPGGVTAVGSCSGTSVCTCNFDIHIDGSVEENGTYTILNNTISMQGDDGSTPDSSPYCVKGDDLHLMTASDSASMGPMGMVRIIGDLVGRRR